MRRFDLTTHFGLEHQKETLLFSASRNKPAF